MKILSIDGGGVRGLIPARIVEELERRVGSPLADFFDVVMGTSTGALVAAALTAPHTSGRPRAAAELPELYRHHGAQIFPMGRTDVSFGERLTGRRDMSLRDEMRASAQRIGSIFGGNRAFEGGARHESRGVDSVLELFFGDVQLADCVTEIRITSFDQAASEPVVFSNRDTVKIRDALRASIAAPTYLAPHRLGARSLIDGGVWANNPSLVALPELLADQRAVLISVGTGHRPAPVEADAAINRSWLRQAGGLFTMITEGESTHHLLERALPPERYIRLQTRLPAGVQMDDPSTANLDALDQAAHELIRIRSADIDRAVALLTENTS